MMPNGHFARNRRLRCLFPTAFYTLENASLLKHRSSSKNLPEKRFFDIEKKRKERKEEEKESLLSSDITVFSKSLKVEAEGREESVERVLLSRFHRQNAPPNTDSIGKRQKQQAI